MENHKGNSCLGEIIILKLILKKTGWGVSMWTNLAEFREQWLAFVNSVMKLCFPLQTGDSLIR